jgi:hypothetical protein
VLSKQHRQAAGRVVSASVGWARVPDSGVGKTSFGDWKLLCE